MGYVVTLIGYRPVARYDGQPFTAARLEEALASTGPWLVIDTIALVPVDADPASPASRSFTTDLATLEEGWYRVVFVDADGNDQVTEPVSRTRASGSSPATIRELAAELGLADELPADDAALMRGAARALTTLRSVLGWNPDPDQMSDDQQEALAEAIALQTVFALEQGAEDYVGVDDRLAGTGRLSFAPRRAPRVSEAARETLAGVGLVRRSGVVKTPTTD